MYADESLLYEDSEVFGGVFNDWRVKRVKKLEYILSRDWLKGKNVLELGCGYGNVGLYLKSLGSNVTFADARQEALDVVKQKDPEANTVILNQEEKWFLGRRFDLVLHFGLLYNLDNWEQDLECTIQHAGFVALETAVSRYAGPFTAKIVAPNYPHKLYGPYSGRGTLVSSVNIEHVFNRLGADYHRYDHKDLNLNDKWSDYCYDWPEEPGPFEQFEGTPVVDSWDSIFLGGRRFWIARNNNAISSLHLLYK